MDGKLLSMIALLMQPEMCVGDHLVAKGPKGRFKYQPGQFRAFGMLAGGSGITPIFQVFLVCFI
ncbi:unnamed protein product [Brassica oleracea]